MQNVYKELLHKAKGRQLWERNEQQKFDKENAQLIKMWKDAQTPCHQANEY